MKKNIICHSVEFSIFGGFGTDEERETIKGRRRRTRRNRVKAVNLEYFFI